MPSAPIAGGLDMLNFNPSNTKPMIELGKQDAANAVKLGEGKSFQLLETYMNLDDQVKENMTFNEYLAA